MSRPLQMNTVTVWLLLGASVLPVLTEAWKISGTYRSSRTDNSRIHHHEKRGLPTFPVSPPDVPRPDFMPSALRHLILSTLFLLDNKKTNRRHEPTLYVNDNAKNDHDANQQGFERPSLPTRNNAKRHDRADNTLMTKFNDNYRTPYTQESLSAAAAAAAAADDTMNGNDDDMVMAEQYEHLRPVAKRLSFDCDITRVTLNTIIEYLRTGKVCGYRVSNVRFGVGR